MSDIVIQRWTRLSPKPFTASQLVRKVRELLDASARHGK
jgi:hypothetical protein